MSWGKGNLILSLKTQPLVTMDEESYKIIDNYLFWLKDNSGKYSIHTKFDKKTSVGGYSLQLLKKYNLIRFKTANENLSYVEITPDGMDCVSIGNFEKYKEQKDSKQQGFSINIERIGHIITGDVSHSDLSIDTLNHSIPPPDSTQPTQIKPHWIKSKLAWIRQNIWKFIIEVAIGLTILVLAKIYLIK